VVERVADASHLSFAGLLAYEANVKSEAETDAEFEAHCGAAMDEAAAVVDRLADAGHEVPEVKVGGTATSLYSGRHPVVDEINPGMFVFMDVGELSLRPWAVSAADCAATVRSTVISAPATGRAVADAGSKSLGMDKPERPVPRREGVSYVAASEEHGWLETEGEELAVGDRLDLIVPHVCTTINLHDTIVGVRDGRVETTWNVQARGKVK
jgi:D-serine deaminase-like pyridoxal phosphate-dependent protein